MNTTTTFRTDRTRFRFEGAEIPVYVARPAAPPNLTVLMFGAIWSVTPHIEDLCNQLASHGHGAIAPCLFRGANIPSRAAPPESRAQTFLDFDDCRCIRDLRAVLHAARAGTFGFAPGDIVPLGFCLGGRFAHYIAALDAECAGVINFYGRLRFARQPNKPFLPADVTGLIEVPYLGHFAEFDPLIPLEDVDELRAALAGRDVPNDIRIYAGARHGFVDPERPTEHHPEAAARAWSATLDFLTALNKGSGSIFENVEDNAGSAAPGSR
jgi:carboxymethylenebutenolidase